MDKQKLTFDEAYNRLQTIVNEIEQGDIGLEELIDKVNEAKQLLNFCKTKLKKVEQQLNEDLKD